MLINSLINNYKMASPRNRMDRTVFFFNSSTNFMQRTGELRGSKLKCKDEDKVVTLKTRYIQRINIQKLRSSLNEEQSLTERQRVSHDNFRYRSLSKRLYPEKRQILEDSDMIITSESNSLPKQKKTRDIPHFQSSNLEGKMNQYLNLIIRKSHQSHQEKVKQIMEGEKEQKAHKFQNMFYRRMKISQNRKKEERQKDESSIDWERNAMKTGQVINNLKQLLKKPKIFLEDAKV